MSKFKVGDKVRVVRITNDCSDGQNCTCILQSNELGKVGTIIDISDSVHINVQYDGESSSCACCADNCFELVSEDSKPQPKFKVGDRVRTISKSVGSCLEDSLARRDNNPIGTINEIRPDSIVINGDFFLETDLELITNNEPSNSSRNKVSKIMGNIKSFVKNSLLSADEKLLRKYGFKDSCGDYTEDAKDFAIAKLCAEKEADMITVAQGLDAEASKK